MFLSCYRLCSLCLIILLRGNALSATGPVNAGFENGLTNWNPQVGTSATSSDAHTGSLAAQVSATSQEAQGLLNSSSFPVTAGVLHRLSGYAKMISATGSYMIAIAWQNASGATITHDNAWQGQNQPACYTLHTGQFTAPVGAVTAVLMLGASSGSSFLFDDLRLEPVGTHLELDNGILRLRLNLVEYGGAITYLSPAEQDRNLVNIFDRGREIQQSYYAGQSLDRQADGQHPAWSPWSWNPIQVGDAFNNSSQVVESYIDDSVAYTKTIPLLWDMNDEAAEAVMEQWTSLHGSSVHVRCKLTCNRTDSLWTQVAPRHQEVPAVYTIADLNQLYTYDGQTSWQGQPLAQIVKQGPPWQYWNTSEHWAAAVDDSHWGVGVYNPDATLFVGGQHGGSSGGATDGATHYISPLTTEALDKDTVYEFEYDLVVGTLQEIRRFVYMKHFGLDFDKDADVDFWDFVIFSAAWKSEPGESHWNADCDVALPRDNRVNANDLTTWAQYWAVNR